MSDIIKNAFANIDPNNKQFVQKNTDIVEKIYELLESKKMTQKELAKLLDIKESEVSKWLSGLQNLTLRSITKMEIALDIDIIMTCSQAKKRYEQVNFVKVSIDANKNDLSDYGKMDFSAAVIKTPMHKLAG